MSKSIANGLESIAKRFVTLLFDYTINTVNGFGRVYHVFQPDLRLGFAGGGELRPILVYPMVLKIVMVVLV